MSEKQGVCHPARQPHSSLSHSQVKAQGPWFPTPATSLVLLTLEGCTCSWRGWCDDRRHRRGELIQEVEELVLLSEALVQRRLKTGRVRGIAVSEEQRCRPNNPARGMRNCHAPHKALRCDRSAHI